MTGWLRRIGVTVLVTAVLIPVTALVAIAGPGSAPGFGVVDPLRNNPNTHVGPFTGSCPWPDSVDAFLPEVEKCLPAAIPWTTDGVRIVSDPMVGVNGGHGTFTFWCQSRVGLRYILTVHGLEPSTVYHVTAEGYGHIGMVRTDPSGGGRTGGVVQLAKGGYDWVVWVGDVLRSAPGDDIGFEVL